MTLPSIPERWCFTDGSWKENEIFFGQGWLSTLKGFDGLLGASNVRACLSPLHAEIEGNGMHEKLTPILGYVYNGLFSVSEDGFGIGGMTSL